MATALGLASMYVDAQQARALSIQAVSLIKTILERS